MRKVLLVGPGGAGKSTLARRLSACTGLPCIHLDAMYWKPGWQATPNDEWTRAVAGLLEREAWIIDGNFGGTLDLRLEACDTVVYLDRPPLLCLWRVLLRRLRFHGRHRPDMTPGCNERLGLEFAWWVLGYRRRRGPALRARLARAKAAGTRVHVRRSSRDIERFMAQLPQPAAAAAARDEPRQ